MFNTDVFYLAYWPDLEDKMQVQSTFCYEHDNVIVRVPVFFTTDLASIPSVLRSLVPVHGRHTPAAIVHDWLYACKGKLVLPNGTIYRYNRAWADEVFLAAMKVSGVSRIKRYSMYSAVRAGGAIAWRR